MIGITCSLWPDSFTRQAWRAGAAHLAIGKGWCHAGVRDCVSCPLTLEPAIIEGAVRRGEPKDAREQALQEAAKLYRHSGLSGAVKQVKLIGRITVRKSSEVL